MSCKDGKMGMDNGKYVRYTPEQVEALERLYHDCPKPSSIRRQQLIRECPILSNIEPKQIKVWFQNRRYGWLGRFAVKFCIFRICGSLLVASEGSKEKKSSLFVCSQYKHLAWSSYIVWRHCSK